MELPVAVGIIYNSIEHAMATGTNRYSLRVEVERSRERLPCYQLMGACHGETN